MGNTKIISSLRFLLDGTRVDWNAEVGKVRHTTRSAVCVQPETVLLRHEQSKYCIEDGGVIDVMLSQVRTLWEGVCTVMVAATPALLVASGSRLA